MAITVLGLDGFLDGYFNVWHAHDWHEGHHLLFINENVIRFGFAKQKHRGGWDIQANRLCKNRGVASDEVAIDHRVGAPRSLTLREHKCFLCESFDLSRVQLNR